MELDWIPKGHNETVDKYLKTLPPEQLPVKGSPAAQDRKQLLQKQIPIHDIDPTLCHELSNDELKQMNDYICHVKQASVGVGQIVSLSNIIKAHLHMINPSEAALIVSRYPKGIPLAEIVKLQSQSRTNLLKQQGLNEKLDKLHLQNPSNKSLPNLNPNLVTTMEENLNPWISNNVRDINYSTYTKDINQSPTNVIFSSRLKPGQNKNYLASNHPDQYVPPTLDEKFLQNPNFHPKNIPSQFVQHTVPQGQPYLYKIGQQNISSKENLKYTPGQDSNPTNSVLVPYNKSPSYKSGETYIGDSPLKNPSYSSDLPGGGMKSPCGDRPSEVPNQNTSKFPGGLDVENINSMDPNFARNLSKYPSGHKNTTGDQSQNFGTPGISSGNNFSYENVEEIGKNVISELPNYLPRKYNVVSEIQSPTKIHKNVKDLAFSTYNPTSPNSIGLQNTTSGHNQGNAFDPLNLALENYPPGHIDNQTSPYAQNLSKPESDHYGIPTDVDPNYTDPLDHTNIPHDQSSIEPKYDQYVKSVSNPPNTFKPIPGINDANNQVNACNQNVPYLSDNIPIQVANIPFDNKNLSHDQNTNVLSPNQYARQNTSFSKAISSAPSQNVPYEHSYLDDRQGMNIPFDHNSSDFRPGQYMGPKDSPSKAVNLAPSDLYDQNVPLGQYNLNETFYPGGNVPNQPNLPYTKSIKKLSELHPGKIVIDEDYLQPSQVTIGAIQDINYPEIKAATQGTNDFYEDYSPDSLREILNNVKLPDCHYCKKPFEENEFAITIDRANVLFHAQCFKCAGCNQILADNVYFYNKETDNVYCGRDYAKVRGFPRCKACDELIFTKEYCLAENSTFHLKHFCCIECDKPLAGQDYTIEDEMPYCLPCFEHSKANKCSSCGNVIKPDEIGCSLNGVHFHAVDDCFACKICKKPLMGKKLLLRNEKLYCSHDCFGTDKK